MALWDRVVARYSNAQLVALTNPDDRGATTINQGKADAAVDDASAAFLTRAQAAYDDTNAQHVEVAVAGVIAYLQSRGGKAEGVAESSLSAFRSECDRMAQFGPRKRVSVQVTPETEPTDRTVAPSFDNPAWDELVPDRPRER